MYLNKLFLCFLAYSFLGWIYETIFCILKTGNWENRGFLYGPICPIYGVGATILFFLNQFNQYSNLQIFFISFFGSLVLEYFTSLILELLFHAVWWDYTNIPLNISGRTSIITSIGFGFGGILITNLIIPNVYLKINNINFLTAEILTYIFLILFTIDMTMTITALTNFRLIIEKADKSINKHMMKIISNFHTKTNSAKEKIFKLSNKFTKINILFKFSIKRVKEFRPTNSIKNKFNLILKQFKGSKIK